jgi:hypothetical protein
MTVEPEPAEPWFTSDDMVLAIRRIKELETEIAALRAPVRPSLEVLQRMANGLDPFDIGRFKCAMAALPHEAPKLSANVSFGARYSIGEQLDRASAPRLGDRLDRAEAIGLRLVENGAEPASE